MGFFGPKIGSAFPAKFPIECCAEFWPAVRWNTRKLFLQPVATRTHSTFCCFFLHAVAVKVKGNPSFLPSQYPRGCDARCDHRVVEQDKARKCTSIWSVSFTTHLRSNWVAGKCKVEDVGAESKIVHRSNVSLNVVLLQHLRSQYPQRSVQCHHRMVEQDNARKCTSIWSVLFTTHLRSNETAEREI